MDNVLPLSLAQCADVFIGALLLGFASTILNLVQVNNERIANVERQNYVVQEYIYDSKFDNTTVYAQDIVAMILQTRENKYVVIDGTEHPSTELITMGIEDILALVSNDNKYHADLIYNSAKDVEGYEITTE